MEIGEVWNLDLPEYGFKVKGYTHFLMYTSKNRLWCRSIFENFRHSWRQPGQTTH